MDKKDNEIKEIKKMSADAYIKNKEIRKNIIKKETLKVDNEIKTKSERLIKALEDLKIRNRRLKHEAKELGKNKLIHS
jgi:hypothetical protein